MSKQATVYTFTKKVSLPPDMQECVQDWLKRLPWVDISTYKWVSVDNWQFLVSSEYDDDQELQNAVWCLADHLDNINLWHEVYAFGIYNSQHGPMSIDGLDYQAQGYKLSVRIMSEYVAGWDYGITE